MKTQEQIEIEKILDRPLPAEAIKAKDAKGLSSINSIYVTQRLNEAYGSGEWSLTDEPLGHEDYSQKTKFGSRGMWSAKVKTRLTLPNGKHYEVIATSDNDDEGNAYKGAITDCITKICSWLGIGAHIWKDQTLEQAWAEYNAKYPAQPVQNPQPKKEPSLAEAKVSAEEWCYKVLPNSHRDYRTEIRRCETVEAVKAIMVEIQAEVKMLKKADEHFSNAPAKPKSDAEKIQAAKDLYEAMQINQGVQAIVADNFSNAPV